MHDDMEQKIKEQLLESLIEHMHDKMGDDLSAKFPKKAMSVEVAAPDEAHLAEGLDKAKDLTGAMPHAEPDGDEGEGSDEDRLLSLIGDDDDGDEDDNKMGVC